MIDATDSVDLFKSVDVSDPPGRVPTAADLALPRLPGVRWNDPHRSKIGHRKPYRRRMSNAHLEKE